METDSRKEAKCEVRSLDDFDRAFFPANKGTWVRQANKPSRIEARLIPNHLPRVTGKKNEE